MVYIIIPKLILAYCRAHFRVIFGYFFRQSGLLHSAQRIGITEFHPFQFRFANCRAEDRSCFAGGPLVAYDITNAFAGKRLLDLFSSGVGDIRRIYQGEMVATCIVAPKMPMCLIIFTLA